MSLAAEGTSSGGWGTGADSKGVRVVHAHGKVVVLVV
jgi:hypothetical protein